MKLFFILILLVNSSNAGWMNVDSMNIKQKWRNKKFNTDALLYVKSTDSLLDTSNVYFKSGLIGINTSSPSNELTVNGSGYFIDYLQTAQYFIADEGIECGKNLLVHDSLTVDLGVYKLRMFGGKSAASSATNYCEIASTETYPGLDNFSLILQPSSFVDNKSIAFIGGTGGKLTLQVLDTTLFQTFTDSNYFDGVTEFNTMNANTINDNGATLSILGDSTFINSKLEVGGTTGPLLSVKSTASGTPTAFMYSSASGAAIGSITNHSLTFYTNNTSRMILNTDGVLRTNGNEINYDGTDGEGLVFESDNDGVFNQQLGVSITPGSIDPAQITSTGRTFLSVSDADNWSSLTLATDRAVENGDLLSMIMFGATNETSGHGIKANIRCYNDGSSAGEEGGKIDFQTKPDAGNMTSRMVIDEAGDIGIGTTSPDQKLVIAEGPDTIKIDAIQWGCVAYTVGMFRGGVNDPDMLEVGSSTIYQPHFAGAATLEEVHGSMKVPDDFIDGDTLFMACRAAPSTTGAGNYKFHFWYSVINETGTTTITTIDDSLTATTTASGTAYEFTAIDLGYIEGLDANSCILFRFFRDPGDAADTYVSDVCCIGAGFKYRKGSLGQLTK